MICYLYLKPKHFNINQSLQCYQVSFVLQGDRKFLMADLSLVLTALHTLPVHFVEIAPSLPTISLSHPSKPHKIPNEKNNKQTQNIKHSLSDLFPSSPFLYFMTFLRSWNLPKLNIASPELGQSRWTVNIY